MNAARTVTAALFISVDGVVEAPQNWHFPYLSPQMAEEVERQQPAAATLVLGRRTYQEWAAHWPHQDPADPLVRRLNGARKLIASRTLTTLDWENSELLPGDAVDAIRVLAAAGGAPLAVAGSPTLVRTLLASGVLTELRLVIHPLVVGKGQRLFSDDSTPTGLALDAVHTHDNGVVVLVYRPVRS